MIGLVSWKPSPPAAAAAPFDPRETIYRLVSEAQIKLLEGVARDIAEGRLPSPHLSAYEALCRAESLR